MTPANKIGMHMTTKDQRVAAITAAITKGGGILAFSRDMGVTHQAVYYWKRRGFVPPARARAIEQKFGISSMKLMDPALIAIFAPHKSGE